MTGGALRRIGLSLFPWEIASRSTLRWKSSPLADDGETRAVSPILGGLGADVVRALLLEEFTSRSSRGVKLREEFSDLVACIGWLVGWEDRKATGLGLMDGLGDAKSAGFGMDIE